MIKILEKIKNKLRSNEFVKNILTLASGQAVGQIITLVSVPILSRIYSQEAFGEFAIVTSTATIITGFATLGLTSAIMAPKENKRSNEVFMTAFITQLIISFLFFAVCLIISPYHRFFNISMPYELGLIFMLLYMLLVNLSLILSIYINRLKQYKVLFWNSLILAISTFVIAIPIGIISGNSIGFFTASVFGYLVACIQMIVRQNPFKIKMNKDIFVSVYKEFKPYVIFQAPSNAISSFTTQLPNQLFASLFGNVVLGNYTMCERVLGLPTRFLGAPICDIYFREITQRVNDNNDLGQFTFALIKKILLGMCVPLIIVIAFGKPIFMFVLGESWGDAGIMAALLAVQYTMAFVYLCVSYGKVAMGKQKVNLVMTLIYFPLVLIPILIGYNIFNSFFATIICFSVGNTVYQVLNTAVTLHYMKGHVSKYIIFVILYIIVTVGAGVGLGIITNSY